MSPRVCSRSVALAFALATALGAKLAGTRDIPLPGPAPRAQLEPVAGVGLPSDASCERCHADIAEEWRSSLHRRAFQNDYFLRAYALEPTPFCRKCHAPNADPSIETPREAREAGVGCAACHVIPAGIVGAHGYVMREGGHAVIGDPRLATPAACGTCHDFPFPGTPGFEATPMQDTLGEHSRSAAAATPCQGCHMPAVPDRSGPPGKTHKSHAFRVQGDKTMMARAITVKNAELTPGEVRLTIEPGAIGHAFPTGDLFRRAEIRAVPLDANGSALNQGSTVVLGRTFSVARVAPSVHARVQSSDTRIAGPRTITLPVPPGTRRARWQIVWQQMPPSLAGKFGFVMSEHEMVFAEGVVTR